jgi:hypothetical protein
MALSFKAGSFTANTSTGNQAVTGVGFQPKALKLYAAAIASDGTTSNGSGSFGFGASSSQRACMTWFSLDAGGSSDTAKGLSTTKILRLFSAATPTVDAEADLVSLDSDGFTIDWTDAPGSAWIILYEAYGGADITDVKVGSFALTASVATQQVTDPGFQPDYVEMIGTRQTAAADAASAMTIHGAAAASGGITQVVCGGSDQDAQNAMVANAFGKSGSALMASFVGTSTSINWEASVSSFDATGFNLSYSTQADAACLIPYLAIKGGRWKVGAESQHTTTGTKSTSGLGIGIPKALSVRSATNVAGFAGIARNDHTPMFGAADGTTEGYCVSTSDDANGTSDSNKRLDRTKAIGFVNSAATVLSAADLSSFDSDGFTLNWTSADAAARTFYYTVANDDDDPAPSATKALAATGVG